MKQQYVLLSRLLYFLLGEAPPRYSSSIFFSFLGSKVTPKNFIMYPQGCVDVKRGALQFASMTLICCGCCYPFVYVCLVLVRRMDQQLFVCLFAQLLRKTPSKNVYTYTYICGACMYVLLYGYSPVVYMMLDITLDTHTYASL